MRHGTVLASGALAFTFLVVGCGHSDAPSNSSGAAGSGASGASPSGGSSGSAGTDVDATGPCGFVNQTCCGGRMCHGDLICLGNFPDPAPPLCRHCGDNGEPCCRLPTQCAAGLECWQTIDSGNHCAPPRDSGGDPPCITSCTHAGGQYCGRFSDNCNRILDCGECTVAGFICGGAGLPRICGAERDSGRCDVTQCEAPTGRYCGMVGDGCGAAMDCGGCRAGMTCGGAGVANVCGGTFPPGDCPPVVCNQGTFTYCGRIGDGCGQALDCGACPDGQACGELVHSVCGSPMPPIHPPPPLPREPPPPPPPPVPPPPH